MGGDWGSWGLKLEDFPGTEVRALLEGGALRVGLGCGGDGGVGPTLVAYLSEAGAGAIGTIEATTAAAAVGMTGALWLTAAAAVGVAAAAIVGGGVAVGAAAVGAAAAAVGSGPGLDPPTGGGEECSSGCCCSGCSGSDGRIRAGVGPASRGRRTAAHLGPEVMPSACLNHAWVGEGKEMERMGGG